MRVAAEQSYKLQDNDLLVGESETPYVLRVRDLPMNEKPREKLLAGGPKQLSVAELLAIVLGVGTKKEDVLAMSRRVLKDYGEKAIIHETDPAKLATALNIPLTKACQVVANFELGRRFFATKAGQPVFVRTAASAYHYLAAMGQLQKEQLRGLYLNSRYQVIHDEVISVGSLTANIVHPREVFAPALEHSAVAVIVAHNHPSGNPTPTADDLSVTAQLAKAGKLLGIDLLDHLVIGSKKYISIMKEDFHG